MKNQRPGNWWVENWLRPLMIAAMVACLAAPFAQILTWMMPGWQGTYFLVFCFLAALEGIFSERLLRRQGISGWEYLASRGVEALTLLFILKLANYFPQGWAQLLADARGWLSDPYSFVTNLDLFTATLFLPLWMGAIAVGRLVRELDVEEARPPPPEDKTSTEYYLWLTRPPRVHFYQEALDRLGELWLWGGIGLLLASALVHFLVPTAGAPVISIMLYFALGVALLSQARFAVTHASWRAQQIPIQPGIARRWLVWAMVFLLIIGGIALLLPTDYALGPILALFSLFGILVQVILALITGGIYLLAVLLSLLFPQMERPIERPPPLEPLLPTDQAAGPSATPWWEVLGSVLFWAVILFIVGYALVRFLRERFGLFSTGEGAETTLWDRLLAWLRDLWLQWRLWQQGVQEGLARRRAQQQRERSLPGTLSRLFSLRRLPPRELVRYFYLSTARRAAQAGQPRHPAQTPHEYQVSLDSRFPNLEPDLTGLTDAFVQARYSPQPVQEDDAQAVKPLWQRIKTALRRRRPTTGSPKPPPSENHNAGH